MDDLKKAASDIVNGNKTDASTSATSKDNIEENTGVDFPGE